MRPPLAAPNYAGPHALVKQQNRRTLQNNSAKQLRALVILHRGHFAAARRDFCFAETDRIISFPPPLAGIGIFAWASAAAINSRTSGRANTFADSSRIKRF